MGHVAGVLMAVTACSSQGGTGGKATPSHRAEVTLALRAFAFG